MAWAKHRYTPLWLALVVGTLAVLVGFAFGHGQTDQLQLAARYTARVGYPIFLITYTASSLARLWPNDGTRTLLRNRRQWGLGFAITHTIHLVALIAFYVASGTELTMQTIAGGGLAYVLLYVMAATSNTASIRALGKWWKRLHTAGIHWLWFIFAFSYFGRVMGPDQVMEGSIALALGLGALGLRIAAWKKGRQAV